MNDDSAKKAPPEKTQYDVQATEAKWRERWLADETYKWDPDEPRENGFTIDTPPPYASGNLHIGHVYSYSQTDCIARFMRMQGKNVFYPMGWDDNGLPTERQTEKARGVKANDMSREDFIKLCYEVVEEHEAHYTRQFQQLGLSVDWRQNYQTISASSRRMSQLSIIDLYNKGYAYRQLEPSLWDPADQTTLAQSEIEDKELPGTMWEIPFFAQDGSEIVVATTRPELLGACVALMVSPEKPELAKLAGQMVATPLYGVSVRVIADEKVDPEKGTGAVMCCTFGDVTDKDWWKTYKLDTRVVLDKRGRIVSAFPIDTAMDIATKQVTGSYSRTLPWLTVEVATDVHEEIAGLTAKQAKAKIIELLSAAGLIRGQTEVLRNVPCAERSGAPLEIIATSQWFIRVLDKKAALKAQGQKITWTPDFMRVRFEQWVEGLKWDWGISRQRHFGVPLPFWYSKRKGEEGRVIAADVSQLPVDPLVDLPKGYSREEVEPDYDVMDTWATSSLTPQLSAHGLTPELMDESDRYAKLYPATMRPQGHEIIRTWAFYTIVKSYLHTGSIPWETAAISGWCLAADKSKMSKSKGNQIEPHVLIDEFGADVVRYWAANGKLGNDTAYDANQLKIGKKLQTKLWNAARFVGMQIEGFAPTGSTLMACQTDVPIEMTLDRWLSTRLAETVAQATDCHKQYDYTGALKIIESFFWNDFCDNYLELVKARVYGEIGDAAGKRSAQTTLYFTLQAILKLFAPVMPNITEELYSTLFAADFTKLGSIHARGQWPEAEAFVRDTHHFGDKAVRILAAVRKAKTNAGVSIKTPLRRIIVTGMDSSEVYHHDLAKDQTLLSDIQSACGTEIIEFTSSLADGLPVTELENDSLRVQIELAGEKAA